MMVGFIFSCLVRCLNVLLMLKKSAKSLNISFIDRIINSFLVFFLLCLFIYMIIRFCKFTLCVFFFIIWIFTKMIWRKSLECAKILFLFLIRIFCWVAMFRSSLLIISVFTILTFQLGSMTKSSQQTIHLFVILFMCSIVQNHQICACD